ncbi:MAG TPA: 2,3-bisphosphoglycerate-independent phosphoglycerate mutase, partial [Casimicrobiaceae bacterium]
DAARAHGADVVITADHGNAERMHDETTGQAHTANTRNLVPFVYVGRRTATLTSGGALQDVAPTLLAIMGLPRPAEMTGQSLIHFQT